MSAKTVALDILKLAKSKGKGLTPLQLMKMVYIAYGFHLASTGRRRLFEDDIEAWKYGPVVPNLYHETKSFGRTEISYEHGDDFPFYHPDEKTLLSRIVDVYGAYPGTALSNLTHREGTHGSVPTHPV